MSDIKKVQEKFFEFLKALDVMNHADAKDTAERVAKMYCRELFAPKDFDAQTESLNIPSDAKYNHPVVQKNISINTVCRHHFLPILMRVSMAYIPNRKKVIGLSKLNRIAEKCAARPVLQEELTYDILQSMKSYTGSDDCYVEIVGIHMCVKMRGVKHDNCEMVTKLGSGQYDR